MNVCRLCLRNLDGMKKENIFDLFLANTLYWQFNVEVDVTDEYTKWICQKCLNILIYVEKVRKFFQTNQYLLKERECPQEFDVEKVNLMVDKGIQTRRVTECNLSTCIKYRNFIQNNSSSINQSNKNPNQTSNVDISLEKFESTRHKRFKPSSDKIISQDDYVPLVSPLKSESIKVEASADTVNDNDRLSSKHRICENPNRLSVGTHTSNIETSHTNYITVPIDTFNLFKQPYILLERLSPNEIKDNERGFSMEKRAKKKQVRNNGTAERKLINKNIIVDNKDKFDQNVDNTSTVRQISPLICQSLPEKGSDEEIDVMNGSPNLSRLINVPDVVMFENRLQIMSKKSLQDCGNLQHDHDYIKNGDALTMESDNGLCSEIYNGDDSDTSNDFDAVSLPNKLLFNKVKKTKYEILMWEEMRQVINAERIKGNESLKQNIIREKLYSTDTGEHGDSYCETKASQP